MQEKSVRRYIEPHKEQNSRCGIYLYLQLISTLI